MMAELIVGILKLLMWGSCLIVGLFVAGMTFLLLAGAWIEWRRRSTNDASAKSDIP